MRAMILAAGRGERLRPLTESMPKPMIPVSSEPLIVHQLKWLKRAGIRDIVINLHHLGEQIESHVGSGKQYGINVSYTHEAVLLDTGGGIFNALPKLGDEPFLVLNGDVWTNFRFADLAKCTTDCAHLILTRKPSVHAFGDFSLEGGYVTRYEDPQQHELTFCGISIIHPQIFDNSPRGAFSLTRDLLFNLIAKKEVTGEIFDGLWIDIGTQEGLKHVRRVMT